MCHLKNNRMDTNPSTVSSTEISGSNATSPDSDDRLRDLLSALNLPALPTGGSRIRLIAIGSPAPVTELINRLHRCGIEVPMWTPAQPIPHTDEVVRIYSQNYSQRPAHLSR